MISFKEILQRLSKKFGFDIIGYNHNVHPLARRLKLISCNKINLIFDVGANTGKYARQMRELGYKGRIVSFEPVKSAYDRLLKNSNSDSRWETANIGLADYDGEAEINISRNMQSNSLLDILPAHIQNAPDSAYVNKEKIIIHKIDSTNVNKWVYPNVFRTWICQSINRTITSDRLHFFP